MTRAILLLALTAGVTGCASHKPPTWFLDGAGDVEIADVVDVELYRGEESDGLPAIAATLVADDVEEEWLSRISLADPTQIPASLAETLGLTVKDEVTVIPELRVGELVLRKVRAQVSGSDVVLGVGTWPGVTTAILPSQGVVRFAASSGADTLFADVGEPVAATPARTDEFFEHGRKGSDLMNQRYLPATIGGVEGLVALITEDRTSRLHAELDELPTRHVTGVRWQRAEGEVAGVALDEAWFQVAAGLQNPDGDRVALIGYDLLHSMDIVIDPDTDRIALAPIEDPTWDDPASYMVDAARTKFDEAAPEADGAEASEDAETSDGPDAGDAAEVGRHTAFAKRLWIAGQVDEAVEHFAAAAEAAGDTCQPYLDLGRHLLQTGDAEGAVAPLEKAGDLYERWWSQSRELRKDIEADKDVPEGAWTLAQPATCHEAWGLLASAHLALGDLDAVDALHASYYDLDPELPRAYGLAQLRREQWGAANGALRQALNLHRANDVQLRLAMGYANHGLGRAEVLDAQYDRLAVATLDPAFVDALAAVEIARAAGGDTEAAAVAERMVTDNPLSVTAHLAKGWALSRAGGDVAPVVEAVMPLVDAAALRTPSTVEVPSWRAVALALSGDAEAAAAALETAAEAGPPSPDHAAAAFAVAAITGDSAAAEARLVELTTRFPWVAVPAGR